MRILLEVEEIQCEQVVPISGANKLRVRIRKVRDISEEEMGKGIGYGKIGKGAGTGSSPQKLEKHITSIKYTILSLSVVSWVAGACVFGICIWLRTEPNFSEWMEMLDVEEYYIGVYVMMAASLIVMGVSFLGCCSALMENHTMIYAVSLLPAFSICWEFSCFR
ncbi:hypothetical protein J437_LFUL003049 [Ladona fulva]|uniref:Uncharacterized protein n=1 Tax=Ladona fulva TaxID=123851 RepID=A0A8K0K284_LADFU|nr:hypothetical protein J437_LFUL003049 [Ladona fulva]